MRRASQYKVEDLKTPVFGFILLIGVTCTISSTLPNFLRAEALAAHGKPVTAFVNSHYFQNTRGRTISSYEFAVNEHQYMGLLEDSDSEDYKGTIQVFYLPGDPSNSNINPSKNLALRRFSLIAITILNLVLLTILLRLNWKSIVMKRFAKRV